MGTAILKIIHGAVKKAYKNHTFYRGYCPRTQRPYSANVYLCVRLKQMVGVPWGVIFASALCCRSSALPSKEKTTMTVSFSSGIVRGLTGEDDVTTFHGIPFAAPPLKELRWKQPQAMPGWKHVLDATGDKNSTHICPQLDVVRGEFVGNEDCLQLSVLLFLFSPLLLPFSMRLTGPAP